MKSSKLLNKINIIEKTPYDVEVTGIGTDSRYVKNGDCFVCVCGYETDGHSYAEKALANGAVFFLMSRKDAYDEFVKNHAGEIEQKKTAVCLTDDTRHGLAMVSCAFYENPSEKMKLVGITGTKGKTTTAILVRNIMDAFGYKTGLVGTMYNAIGDKIIETNRTTPEANVLQGLFAQMVEEKVDACVMEASSQGLRLERTGGCDFDIGVFTNLSPDHIGKTEHKDMDDYAEAKGLLFSMCKKGIFNCDNAYFQKIKENATCGIITFGIDNNADYNAENIILKPNGVEYDLVGKDTKIHIATAIPGRMSVYNSMCAAVVCLNLGIDEETIKKGLKDVVIKGKAEIVPTGRDFTVMIDYAHNPDSFINIIGMAKEFAKRTVFLFGAGGDRNRPRELMGETAATHADFTIVTSDNPRSEDPASIVADIEKGVKKTGKPYVCIVDRKEAIFYAIRNAQPGDFIILAGKGHETYQIFKDKTIEFDERKIVKEALEQ